MPSLWTNADFETLSWHDCHVHGLRLRVLHEDEGTAELDLDIDFILEWLPQPNKTIHFRVAPATLTFHEVTSLRVLVDYVTPTAGMTPFSLDGIERDTRTYPNGYTSYHWRLPINWPAGEITFDSPGFTQVLHRDPVVREEQAFATSERGARLQH